MSYDGTFSCESSLKRLLARCSGLRSDRKLLALSQKVGVVTAEDIVEAIAEPFLHPKYTIPIVGCFRPLCRLIVDRAVTKLGSVPSLISMSDEESDDIGEDDTRVIDFYMERGRGLRLHEMASLALCRALDLAPFLLRCILNYFRFSPQPFGRLELVGFNSQITDEGEKHLLDVIRLTYRFLIMEPQIFSGLWDWTCFLDLIQQTSDAGAVVAPRRLINILDIRWCGIQILSTSLKISDRATEDFGLDSDEAFACLLRFEEFCQDTSLEKAGFYLPIVDEDQERCSVGIGNFSQLFEFDYNSLVSSTNLLKIESGMKDVRCKVLRVVPGKPFVMTSTIRGNFEMTLMAVGQRWPILLHGPAGSGKTAIINTLAEISHNQVLFIHMDDQMDSKMLIGNYVCSNQPGEFRWHPGSLTQAISKGYWVVFEDIDKAPIEVQSIILPLLEGSSIFVTGHGEEIDVSENFRMFATISTLKHEVSHEIEGRLSFSTLWRKVLVKIPNSGDMTEIVNAWYPNLNPLTSRLMDTFIRINSHSSNQVGVHACRSSSGTVSRFSLRDLLKWCKRISNSALSVSGFPISVTDCQAIYHEAVETFVAYLPCSPKKLLMMREIAKVWGVPLPETEHDYPPNKPVIQSCRSHLQVGRVALPFTQIPNLPPSRPFVGIRSSLHALERVASSVKYNEPVLLVGETGTGKTTIVQNLAMRLGQQLTVLNLSQQSDIADLLGGYKPADARSICIPLYQEFKELFCRTFSEKENESLLRHLEIYAVEKKWKKLLCACQRYVDFVIKLDPSTCGSKRKRPLTEVLHEWGTFSSRVNAAQKQIGASSGVYFKFVEGAFITALRNGYWILLDEINLAPPETLQRIIGVLDNEKGTLCLAERGDIDYIKRHPSFRLFACMNPATDAGKRELSYSLRSRFTEYFVDDILDENDLTLFIRRYMDEMDPDSGFSNRIVQFYKAAKRESEERLQDGANQKPQFSLRSLARALEYIRTAGKTFGIQKALYDGFCMFFLTMLDRHSAKIMHSMIVSYILGGSLPKDVPFDAYFSSRLNVHDVSGSVGFSDDYVLTRSVKENLKNIARAVFIKKFPVLLQGPTSSGKTSLVHYLAAVTGHEFVRINNHEHTDLQEYFGTYITDSQGRLLFQEGVLVKAVRLGYWIVLDELNLAPSDVLEALNRLLDDNRELFIPELQETIHAHPNFMLFATQNPPTLYGGRKMLSRAFRNRFLEIHADEIPEDELSMILELRCKIPSSYASKMVEVMKELQLHRQHSKIFAGKHGFITPRDLFRWANRFRMFGMSYEDLAKDGYFLLAERLRDENEKVVVKEALERHLRAKINVDNLYMEANQDQSSLKSFEQNCSKQNFENITWTNSLKRLFFLVERCYRLREPVLLIGETGGGKTTVCQLLSVYLKDKLHILNCHQYTETSDFIGGFYPIRDRSKMSNLFIQLIEQIKASRFFNFFSRDELSTDITKASSTINILNELLNTYKQNISLHTVISEQDHEVFQQLTSDLIHLHQKWQTIFLWQDGPLVQAMKNGDLFLVDEISLADDSVLERLNSVLEPERKLSLAEKGGAILEQITAHPNFFLLATMNPGGDYGKKELSPALRNRFTEIWVPPVSDMNEFRSIAQERFINPDLSPFASHMLNFWEWFNMLQIGRSLTLRDLLSWVSFVNVVGRDLGSICAFLHGSFLVLLDGLSLGTCISKHDSKKVREHALSFLVEELKACNSTLFPLQWTKLESYGWGDDAMTCNMIVTGEQFGIRPFCISKGKYGCKNEGFEFLAPTTSRNVLRVLRAMQLSKPVLLEGSPGVGKTSLVVALGEYSGHSVVRINLSEQTDMMDLLGSDLPTQKDNGMEFSWSDGILLKALKDGSWVLLDELNLAPQSVLEGLNAILDHRAEVFIPELGLTFKCPPSFRIFACQNPSHQGGGRKSLPRSFLNRFTKVYVDELDANDYLFICRSQYPSIPETVLSNLICFNKRLFEDTMIHRKYGQEGSPWEFNLRDVIRSCQIIEGNQNKVYMDSFLNIVYLPRMRTVADRCEVLKLYEEVFELKPSVSQFPKVHVNPDYLVIGSACAKRNYFQPSKLLKSQLNILPGLLHSLEVGLHCVQQQWLCILVGPYSSGKTSLVRLLAHLTGNTLHELNLSPGTDVTDLLGSFEQYNSFRNYKDVITQVEHYIGEYFSLKLEEDWMDLINQRKDLISKWFSFLASRNKKYSLSASLVPPTPKQGYCDCLHLFIEIIELLQHVKDKLPVSWSKDDLEILLTIASGIKKNMSLNSSANFEWVSGHLIKAIQNGDWVILENANLCNPTVLDRINSLFEPSGSIIINECGLLDGKPMVLQAHPNFRMFITVDPKHGEVSRAMRNRGVEIFMMNQIWLPTEEVHLETDREDVKRFLILSGIPCNKLVSAMTEAHMSLTKEGSCLGVRITLRELSRWVQLFQQLLLMGNRPKWSLQLSWEHTYLSSFGEDEGVDAVMKAKFSYLSDTNWYVPNEMLGPSLHLPKGWPSPLTLRYAKWYSRETSTRESCLFLEFLLFQSASCEFQTHDVVTAIESRKIHPSIIPVNMLYQFLFPDCAYDTNVGAQISIYQFDLALINNMLFFAANWSIEQAMESDTSSYVLLFKWYGSQVQQCCQYFNYILNILQSEINHSIWKCICEYWKDVISYRKIDVGSRPLPLLSCEEVNFASHEILKDCQKSSCSAADCVRLLSLTYRQWNIESDSLRQCESLQYPVLPVLDTLGRLEKKALEQILKSHEVQQIYTELIEYHMLFWQNIFSSNHDLLSITWSFLRREIEKLRPHFPECVDAVVVEMNNMPIWDFDIEKHALWLYGGHPFFPASSDVYDKMQQLFTFCDEVWQKARLTNEGFDDDKLMINFIISTDLDLKQLALKALCMSSYLATKGVQDDIDILAKIDELYQGLTGRFEHKKRNLALALSSARTIASFECSIASCCTFCLQDLCQQSDFEEWLVTVSLFDVMSFLFDLELLSKFSKCMLADTSELHEGLLNLSDSLVHSVEYALSFSSRSPMDFTPHQTILWILDAWKTFDSVNVELSMIVIDMWFKFHSFLWSLCSKTNPTMKIDFEESCLVLPSRTVIIDKILQSNFSIVDYDIQCLKLRTTSRNLWQATLSQGEIVWFLCSAADSLFKQIIFVHYKYFTEDVFCKIKSILCSAFGNSTLEDILNLKSLISSSNHTGLCSVMDLLVEPILRELYLKHPPSDYLYNLGRAWLHIGMLRFYLLNQDGPDPALEFSFKHSNMLRKISLFDLETKVRQECQLLSGKGLVIDNEDQRLLTSQKLKAEEKQLRAKVVFRPSCSEYSHFRSECFDYGKLCSSLIEDLKNMGNIPSMVLCNWQATSSKFINHLSEKYANYADLVQPVQVAVYEMKLGVSLVSSSALQKDYLEKVGGVEIQKIKAEVYSFMQFPRSLLYDSIPVNLKNYEQDSMDEFVFASATTNFWSIELMKKLINYSSETNLDKKVSPVLLDNVLHYVMLIQTADHVLYSHILDKDCFLVLNCTFDRFAKQWMDMKTELKAKEDDDQNFKFRTRLIKIEDIMEEEELSDNAMDFDESLLSGTSKNEQMIPVEEDKQIEEEWELIHETFSKSLVRVHSLLYGSTDVVENPSARFIARDDRLISFFQSYKLGTRIIKDIDALTPVSDDQLMPEYLFRVCLEYEETFGIARKPPHAYNIYKDSNSIVLHKMIKPLGTIQERVERFLVEWPDHPGLQSLGNIIEKLLSAPLITPVPKALLGLQILVHKAKFLQENASMFSFKDLLDPIYSLISSWQKLELDSWKTLLDDVEEKFNINAAKLWFPLYAVLHRGTSDDAEADKLFTIQSIEEFVKSSNVGEFKKRLDLLFSFQGQLNHGVVLNAYSSPTMRENVNVLYNAFGYYVQFLHIVVDYIETERKSIEKDLREQLKLFSWERSHDSSIESFSRMRQKIRKLVQKYNEVLQQPLMLVVHQEAISKREKIPAWLENWTSDETNVDVLQCPLSVVKINNAKRFFWFTSWMDKANMLTKNDILCAQGLSDVKHTLTSATSFNELEKSWEESWFSIENISRKAAQFAHIWRHGTKNLTKRRMLGNLLKVLEKSGLSRHRHISNELWISMYSHPSYNVLHLHLLGDLHKSSRNIATSNQIQSDNQGDDIFGFKWKSTNITSQDNKGDDIIGSKWKFANQLYFKNLSVMNQLQEVCLNFSKDLSKEQVDQTNSFLCQLVFIQQEQRDVMYSVYEQLKKLQLKLQWTNGGEQSEGLTIAMNQSALLMLMWKQKNVFDNLLAMSRETNMLLESFKSCHLDTCKVIKDEVDRIYSVIDMFLPRFSKSKELLDMYLVCNDTIVSAANELPFLVTQKMEDLVISNSEIINAFEESIIVFSFDKAFPRSIGGTLLSRFEEIINKGKLKVLMSQIDKNRQFATRENSKNLETFYTESYERTIKLLLDVYEKLYTNSVNNIPVLDLSGQITLWNQLFHSYEKVLRLEEIDDALGETISAARKFVDSTSDRKDEVCSQMQIQLRHLYALLDLILTFGDGILSEFLDVHAAVAELTNVLAHIFILIFSKGFGSSQEAENSKCNGTEDASGTGMGEGEGVNDVSDQIEDESQLLGTSEKHDGHDELEKQPNSNDKGIEMEEDFDGETFSVSEDSEDDDDLEDDEDLNLDSQMGQTAEGDQIVDEKLWDGDEEDNTENRSEKYEPGPAVNEKDSGSREITAKDDNALAADDSEDVDKNQDDRLNEEDNDSKKNQDFNSDDMFVDKSQAFEDPTNIQIEEEAKQTEDADMNEPQGSDMDGSELGSFGSDEEMNDVDDKSKEDNAVDEDVSQVDNNSRIEVGDKTETANMEPESNKETLPSDAMETFEYPLDGKESIKSSGNSHKIESMVSDMLEADNNDINSSIAPSRSLLSDEMSKIEIASNSVDNSKISYDQSQLKPENSQDSCSRTRPNPYRSLGDAMEDWKERAKVSVDPLENLPELVENLANEDAEEYEFVADAEKSTSQALAAATADQINNNVDSSKSSVDENHRRKNEDTNQNRVKENSDTSYLNPRQDLASKKKDDELPYMDIGTDSPMEEMGQISNLNNQYESMVSFKSSYMDEKESLLNTGTDDKAFSNSLGIEDMSEGALQETVLEWKRYEVSTTRLSQELAEQLRLVMEPTLASKLQGDYKTGKRINMKKVIPYIASHFRKDKIWLRRTKPNKRNYQVVVAVDDSRSMSESNCGNAAIEALITVCRAMSQLEVGQFAVASFGRKGNVRLLHDFDEPFTGEAGVKIMSNLSFKQDNAIVDEPLVDLLKYLNDMLDNAVSRARMPSGQNPLNQLVLIIADGRIHEKENLKRHVRDALNKKRLIALILLDSPEESIIDLMEASYEGDRLSFKKYLNTFPFPYYIILRNIEALPRTLADLLRQWFELMRNAME